MLSAIKKTGSKERCWRMRPKPTRPDDARALLLSSARELFLTIGYDNTSVDAINAKASLSKGTFYHYFKSKSDLLDAIIEEITNEGWQQTRRAMEDKSGGAVDRFLRFLAAARRWRIVVLPQNAAIMCAALSLENSLLRERMRARSIRLAESSLAELIADGNREGAFNVDRPSSVARVFLILAYGVSDDMVHEIVSSRLSDNELLDSLVSQGRAFMRSVEGLLGVPPGSLGEPESELLAEMVRAFRAKSVSK
jgi:AcrR family transcriptional regulator